MPGIHALTMGKQVVLLAQHNRQEDVIWIVCPHAPPLAKPQHLRQQHIIHRVQRLTFKQAAITNHTPAAAERRMLKAIQLQRLLGDVGNVCVRVMNDNRDRLSKDNTWNGTSRAKRRDLKDAARKLEIWRGWRVGRCIYQGGKDHAGRRRHQSGRQRDSGRCASVAGIYQRYPRIRCDGQAQCLHFKRAAIEAGADRARPPAQIRIDADIEAVIDRR